jgi:hypothetical protein
MKTLNALANRFATYRNKRLAHNDSYGILDQDALPQ